MTRSARWSGPPAAPAWSRPARPPTSASRRRRHPGTQGRLTFVITPNESTDPDLSNNTAEVTFGGAAAAFGDTRVAAQREARAIAEPQARMGDSKAHAKAHTKARARARADGDGRKNWSRQHLLRRGWPLS